ncbi:MAG TPA: hypothetical protein VN181_10365, partial [Thermoanaerobaculia bacterium]|nr:hypothetical protein [Thermoanaerobaculia bacterium]
MRDELPAASPLIGLVAGIACGGDFRAAIAFALIAILALRWRRVASTALFLAFGILIAMRADHRERDERTTFATINANRFVTIDAPLDRDWSPRGETFLL